MPLLKPDPTFYPSPTFATQSPLRGPRGRSALA